MSHDELLLEMNKVIKELDNLDVSVRPNDEMMAFCEAVREAANALACAANLVIEG